MCWKWEVKLGVFLVASSFTVYLLKTLTVGRLPETVSFLFNALGFLPIQVLLVTLILNKLLQVRAQEAKLEKLNMVIGVFFSEMGTDLLEDFANHDRQLAQKATVLAMDKEWEKKDFKRAMKKMGSMVFEVDPRGMDLPSLREFFLKKRNFLLRLMENPMLYEHESFTDVLRAVFHLTDELGRREEWHDSLPESDMEHLQEDFNRVYRRLAPAWVQYMDYQRENYPYIYSIALRTNPFDRNSSVVVRE